jgi:uncharacterized membrane protein YfcA
MDLIHAFLDPLHLALALIIAILAGMVKGMVGFAMPMILISGLTTFLPPEIALAGLIVPTLVTNGMQALAQGRSAAWSSIRRFRVFLLAGLICLLLSAQSLRFLPTEVILLVIGGPIVLFALLQIFGIRFHLAKPSHAIEAVVGGFAGAVGGVSGVWGPPTVAYLTAIDTAKGDQMRVQGVIYGLGAVALLFAHVGSGIVTWGTLPFSILLVPPAVLGMWLGGRISARIDQAAFRKATLFVLLIAGANLVRRGLMG